MMAHRNYNQAVNAGIVAGTKQFITATLISEATPHTRHYNFLCKCGHKLETHVRADDKAGEYCEHCSRVYDVWFDGRVEPMPVHETTTVDPRWRGLHSRRAPVQVDK